MTGETMPALQEKQALFLTLGEGTIDPASRVAKGEITEAEIEQFEADLYGSEYDVALDERAIPDVCVDGRGLKIGGNAAGGTFSLVVADALSNQSYHQEGEDAAAHAETIFTELKKNGHAVGGHDDDQDRGPLNPLFCGCGAQDRLDNLHDEKADSILGYIARRSDDIRAFLESPYVGLTISDELHNKITIRSNDLRAEHYASNGPAIKKATIAAAGEEAVVTDKGVHNEVVLKIQTQAGKTIDRTKLRQKYGERLQAFELDLPALRNGVEAISLTAEEADEKFIAALYYNVATASTLAGPSLRIVIV